MSQGKSRGLSSEVDKLLAMVDSLNNPVSALSNGAPLGAPAEDSKGEEEKKMSQVMEEEEEEEERDAEGKLRLQTARGTRDYHPNEMILRQRMKACIRRNFDRCGAQWLETPVMELRSVLMDKYGEDEKLIYDLAIPEHGEGKAQALSLRYDLTVPLARYVAQNRKELRSPFKPARFGRVYRRDQPRMTKGRYREFWQCDFDIVRLSKPNDPMDLAFDDLEIVTLFCQTLLDLQVGDFVLRLNNRKVLDAMLQYCGVPACRVPTISAAIDKLDKKEWSEIRGEMVQKGISEKVAHRIREFVVIRGAPQEVLDKLRSLDSIRESAKEGIQELQTLIDMVRSFNPSFMDLLAIDMSMVRGLDYYTGIIMEVQLRDPVLASEIGSICGGGRYDKLIEGFVSGDSETFPCIGASLGFERIFTLLFAREARLQAQVCSNATDVLVCEVGGRGGKGGGDDELLFPQRLALVGELRGQGLRTEMVHKARPDFRDQINFAETRNIPWMVIIGEDEVRKGTVNLRRLTLVGDEVVIKSKDKKRGGRRAVILRIEQSEQSKFPFFFVQADGEKKPWRVTKKEIGQVVCRKSGKVLELQVKDVPRAELKDFLVQSIDLN